MQIRSGDSRERDWMELLIRLGLQVLILKNIKKKAASTGGSCLFSRTDVERIIQSLSKAKESDETCYEAVE